MRKMLMKRMNNIVRMMPRRSNRRNTFLLSLLGIGIAGGATALTMKRGNMNGIKRTLNQMVKKPAA